MFTSLKAEIASISKGLALVLLIAMSSNFLSFHYNAPVILFALLIGIAFNFLNNDAESIALNSASGELKVYKQENFLQLDFPKDNFKEVDMIEAVENATSVRPLETYLGDINLFAVFDNEDTVSNMTPNFDAVLLFFEALSLLDPK